MVQTYSIDNAPSFAKHSSSFKNDKRCYPVHFVVGAGYDEVQRQTKFLAQADEDIVDYDVNYSTEGESYVGVTCKDY